MINLLPSLSFLVGLTVPVESTPATMNPTAPPLSQRKSLFGQNSVLERNGGLDSPEMLRGSTLTRNARFFPIHDTSDPLTLSIAACQVFSNRTFDRIAGRWTMTPSNIQQVIDFLSMFRDSWTRTFWPSTHKRFVNPPKRSEDYQPQDVVIHYHMRFLSVSSTRPDEIVSALKFRRMAGSIRHPSASRDRVLFVRERRLSVAIRTTCDLDLPIFSLVTLADIDFAHRAPGRHNYHTFSSSDLHELSADEIWEEIGIRPSIRSAGVSAFAFRIYTICSCWAEHWTASLDELDEQLTVTVNCKITSSQIAGYY